MALNKELGNADILQHREVLCSVEHADDGECSEVGAEIPDNMKHADVPGREGLFVGGKCLSLLLQCYSFQTPRTITFPEQERLEI